MLPSPKFVVDEEIAAGAAAGSFSAGSESAGEDSDIDREQVVDNFYLTLSAFLEFFHEIFCFFNFC